jgi:hypothetical protein
MLERSLWSQRLDAFHALLSLVQSESATSLADRRSDRDLLVLWLGSPFRLLVFLSLVREAAGTEVGHLGVRARKGEGKSRG